MTTQISGNKMDLLECEESLSSVEKSADVTSEKACVDLVPFERADVIIASSSEPILDLSLETSVENLYYICSACKAIFPSSEELVEHEETHRPSKDIRIYVCGQCKGQFLSYEILERHLEMHRKEKQKVSCKLTSKPHILFLGAAANRNNVKFNNCKRKSRSKYPSLVKGSEALTYPCSECDKVFTRKSILRSHEVKHARGMLFRCRRCEIKPTFKSRAEYILHGRKMHYKKPPEKTYLCEECGKQFKSYGVFRGHLTTHIPIKPFECDVCGKRFRMRGYLTIHKRLHSDQRPYVCSVCGNAYKQKKVLDQHVLIHTSDTKPHKCDTCGLTFLYKGNLTRHMLVHTDERPYACETCGKCFKSQFKLTEHSRLHSEDKKFSCEKCGKKFRQKQNLMTHILSHTAVKSHPCSVCGKCFKSESYRAKHELVHQAIKPSFLCDLCGKSFLCNDFLMNHRRKHKKPQDREYPCDQCEKTFKNKAYLNIHQASHSDEKRYSCTVCTSKFKTPSNLSRHMKLLHPDKLFSCSVCSRVYRNEVDLSKHFTWKHGVSNSEQNAAVEMISDQVIEVMHIPISELTGTMPQVQEIGEVVISCTPVEANMSLLIAN